MYGWNQVIGTAQTHKQMADSLGLRIGYSEQRRTKATDKESCAVNCVCVNVCFSRLTIYCA